MATRQISGRTLSPNTLQGWTLIWCLFEMKIQDDGECLTKSNLIEKEFSVEPPDWVVPTKRSPFLASCSFGKLVSSLFWSFLPSSHQLLCSTLINWDVKHQLWIWLPISAVSAKVDQASPSFLFVASSPFCFKVVLARWRTARRTTWAQFLYHQLE